MPARDGNRSPRDDRSWGSRAKDFVICAEAALRGKKGDPYPLNNSSLARDFPMDRVFSPTEFPNGRQIFLKNIAVTPLKKVAPSQKRRGPQK